MLYRNNILLYKYGKENLKHILTTITEASQPSLGTEAEHGSSQGSGIREVGGKFETPPPSPMYPSSGDSHNTQIMVNSKSKTLHQKSIAAPTMITHWEEAELPQNPSRHVPYK